MNLLALIKPAFTALKYGSSLSNPTFWANVGGVTVILRLVRDAAQAFFPDAALISDDIVGRGADFIAGLAGAYLMYASNKEAGIKPPIELVAQPELKSNYESPEAKRDELYPPELAHDLIPTEYVRPKQDRVIPSYVSPEYARWLHQPKVQSKPESEFESDGSGGFQGK